MRRSLLALGVAAAFSFVARAPFTAAPLALHPDYARSARRKWPHRPSGVAAARRAARKRRARRAR